MSKKSLAQLQADEIKLLKQLEDIRAGKKDVAKAEAEEARSALNDLLGVYNELAVAADLEQLRLVNVSERPAAGGKASNKRLRLADDTRASISEKIVKAAKAHGKDGASKNDIIKYLDTSGYKLGVNFNELHLFAILNTLRGGDEPSIRTVGEKAKMRYVAA